MKTRPKTLTDLTASGVLSESWLDRKEVEEDDEDGKEDDTVKAADAPVDPAVAQVMPNGDEQMPAASAASSVDDAGGGDQAIENDVPPLDPATPAATIEEPTAAKSESDVIVEEINAMIAGATRLSALAMAMDPTNQTVKALFEKLAGFAAASESEDQESGDAPLEP